MRVLNEKEMAQVNGGVLPIIAAIASFTGHHAVRSVGGYVLSRASTTYAVYGAAQFTKKN